MSWIFALGGVPVSVYDEVVREAQKGWPPTAPKIVGVAAPSSWTGDYTEAYILKIQDRIRQEMVTMAGGDGAALGYVTGSNGIGSDVVKRAFFPYLPCFPLTVEKPLQSSVDSRRSVAEWKNTLADEIRCAVRRMNAALPVLRHEVTSRANKTAILLPCESFRSSVLVAQIETVADCIVGKSDVREALLNADKELRRAHPPRSLKNSRDGKRYFFDDTEVCFKPPGSDRHGLVRAGTGDTPRCELGSRFRLGAAYLPEFHYDCERGGDSWERMYSNCHKQGHRHAGKHINIAPNERARA